MSNYLDALGSWNVTDGKEQQCSRCKGLGSDRDGADCVYCDGMGSVILRY